MTHVRCGCGQRMFLQDILSRPSFSSRLYEVRRSTKGREGTLEIEQLVDLSTGNG